MMLEINGEPRNFDGVSTVVTLVEALGMKTDRVAVELNRQIVPRDRWPVTHLSEGDRLEIVHFVGGGSRRAD
jgi:thiamine biosynthesis protein ThiS